MLYEQVGVQLRERGGQSRFAYDVHESLEELGRLASTAGLEVCIPLLSHCHALMATKVDIFGRSHAF